MAPNQAPETTGAVALNRLTNRNNDEYTSIDTKSTFLVQAHS